MKKLIKSISFMLVAITPLFLSACAQNPSPAEAMQRADRALQQAELCNERVDRLAEMQAGK